MISLLVKFVLIQYLTMAIKINKIEQSSEFLTASYSSLKIDSKNNTEIKALVKIIIEHFESYQKINKKISNEIINNIKTYSDYNKLADVVTANININLNQKQELLEMVSIEKRLNKIYSYLLIEIDSMQVEKKIKGA